VSARHYFSAGLLQASVSKANARDLSDGTPVPEAPRLIRPRGVSAERMHAACMQYAWSLLTIQEALSFGSPKIFTSHTSPI